MHRLIDTLTNKTGDALAGYLVKLRKTDDSLAPLFSDSNSTPIVGSSGIADTMVTDDNGEYGCYVADGSYAIEFYEADGTTPVKTVPDVPMFSGTAYDSATAAASAATATTQAGIATTQAGVATTAATTAAADVSTALATYVTDAQTAQAGAETAQAGALTSATNAAASAGNAIFVNYATTGAATAGSLTPSGGTNAGTTNTWFHPTPLSVTTLVNTLSVVLSASGTGDFVVIGPDGRVLKRISATGLALGTNNFTTFTPFVAPAGSIVGYGRTTGGQILNTATGASGDSLLFLTSLAPAVGDFVTLTAGTRSIAVAMSGAAYAETVSDRLLQSENRSGARNDWSGVIAAAAASTGGLYLPSPTTLFQETSSPTTASVENAVVGTMYDGTTSASHATAASDAARPVYNAKAIGQAGALFFNGSHAVSANAVATTVGDPNGGVTFSVAFRMGEESGGASGTGAVATILHLGASGGSSECTLAVQLGYIKFLAVDGANADYNIAAADMKPHVVTVSTGGGKANIWLDGELVAAGITALSAYTPDRFSLGAKYTGALPGTGSLFFRGWIGPVLIQDGKLSMAAALAQHQAIMNYVWPLTMGTGKVQRVAAQAMGGEASLDKRAAGTANRARLNSIMRTGGTVVFPLIGQSNMVGFAPWDSGATIPSGTAQWGRTSPNDGAIIAATSTAMDFSGAPASQFGPWLQFAIDFCAAYPGVYPLFVPCAVGATGFTGTPGDWNRYNDQYSDTIRRVNRLFARYPEAALGGVLCSLGERDASLANAGFAAAQDAMITGMREDIDVADSQTPFVLGDLQDDFVTGAGASGTLVQNAIRNTATRLRNVQAINSTGLGHVGDATHFNAAGQRNRGSQYFTKWKAALCPVPLSL